MSDEKKTDPGAPPNAVLRTAALQHVVELARQELRDKGLSEELIEATLNRRYPPDLD